MIIIINSILLILDSNRETLEGRDKEREMKREKFSFILSAMPGSAADKAEHKRECVEK